MAEKSSIRWIFFDMGYTLINEDGGHHARNLRTAREISVPVDTLEAAITAGGQGYWEAAKALGAERFIRYDRTHEAPYPEAAAVLEALHRRYRLGIIANQPGGSVERLRRYGLLQYFDLVYSSSEIGIAKPDPSFFTAACRAANCAPDEALMVGDRLDNDIAPARAAGMRTARVRQGMHRTLACSTPETRPDFDLARLRDLPKALGITF